MEKRTMFTESNVVVLSAPYLKVMDGESDRCVGYLPKESTENVIDTVAGKSGAEPDWASSIFEAENKRLFVSLSWRDAEMREKFLKEFEGLDEEGRCGIVRDAECEGRDKGVADSLNEKREKKEAKMTEARRKWFDEKGNYAKALCVSVVKGTCVVDGKTGEKRIDPVIAQFLDGVTRFMSKTDQPEDVFNLGSDDDGKFWVAYSFRLATLKSEFERRVKNIMRSNKVEGLEIVLEGAIYENLVMGIVNEMEVRREKAEAMKKKVEAQEANGTEPVADTAEESHPVEPEKAE
jgi:hypothetical protein